MLSTQTITGKSAFLISVVVKEVEEIYESPQKQKGVLLKKQTWKCHGSLKGVVVSDVIIITMQNLVETSSQD